MQMFDRYIHDKNEDDKNADTMQSMSALTSFTYHMCLVVGRKVEESWGGTGGEKEKNITIECINVK